MASSRTTTFTIRVPYEVLAEIDTDAARAGQDRTSYVLKWIPLREYHKAPPRLVRTVAYLDANGEVRLADEPVDAP
jgi:hypothetical protein